MSKKNDVVYCGFREITDHKGLVRGEFHVSRDREDVEDGVALSSSIPAYGPTYQFWKDCRNQEIKNLGMKIIQIKGKDK